MKVSSWFIPICAVFVFAGFYFFATAEQTWKYIAGSACVLGLLYYVYLNFRQ